MGRLTIEEVESQMQNFYGAERKLMGDICQQLADVMRDMNGLLENVPEAMQYHLEREEHRSNEPA